MGLLTDLIGGGAKGVIGGVADAVDRFVTTPDEAAATELKKRALDMQAQLRQLDINQEEAKHASVFVAGARPATMWVCTICMAGIVAAGVYGWLTGEDLSALYALYGSTVAPVHLGLLGLRSWERGKGLERNSVSTSARK